MQKDTTTEMGEGHKKSPNNIFSNAPGPRRATKTTREENRRCIIIVQEGGGELLSGTQHIVIVWEGDGSVIKHEKRGGSHRMTTGRGNSGGS